MGSCKKQEEYMALALELAREASAQGEVPVGCVIADADGKVIGRGRNRRRELADATAHAELEAVRAACAALGDWRLTGCTIYVTLEPCPMCAGAMLMAQLGQCVYGAADPRLGCCGSVYDLPDDPALGGRTQWVAGVCAEECAALLQNFLREKRTEVRHG